VLEGSYAHGIARDTRFRNEGIHRTQPVPGARSGEGREGPRCDELMVTTLYPGGWIPYLRGASALAGPKQPPPFCVG